MRAGMLAVLAGVLSFGAMAGEPLKVLYLTGGGYHNYKLNSPFQVEKLKGLINATFDVQFVDEKMGYVADAKDFGAGFDVIVYDICHANPKGYTKEKDGAIVEKAMKVTRDGKPTVMLHCSMHSFMANDEWTACCGMRTRAHDPNQGFGTTKADPENPILKDFPADWKTPADELYQTINFPETSKALLKSISPKTQKEHVVAWTHTYGKGKVFSTTLGHDQKTLGTDGYLKLLANGILWAADKLGPDGKPLAGYAGPATK